MKTTNIGQVFTSGGVNGLYTTRPNLQSIRFSKGLAWTLRKLVEKREKSKDRGYVEFESAVMGAVRFDCTYRGAKRGWVHKLAFSGGQGLRYEEMRHGITLAIFALTGQYSALRVSFDLLSVEWRLMGGEKMFDHIGKQYEIVSGERGLITDLSRVVTRDIEPNEVV